MADAWAECAAHGAGDEEVMKPAFIALLALCLCHRIVIFMTDEPFEANSTPDLEKRLLKELQQKIQDLNILLCIVASESPVCGELVGIDKSEYEVVESHSAGLADVDFRKLLSGIGKSVSVSTANQQGTPVEKEIKKGVFGQTGWSEGHGSIDTSDRT